MKRLNNHRELKTCPVDKNLLDNPFVRRPWPNNINSWIYDPENDRHLVTMVNRGARDLSRYAVVIVSGLKVSFQFEYKSVTNKGKNVKYIEVINPIFDPDFIFNDFLIDGGAGVIRDLFSKALIREIDHVDLF